MTYIKFMSTTYGQMAAEKLKFAGIYCILKRNPNPNHKEGCNFALFVNEKDIDKALNIINKSGIPNLGMEKFGDGK